MYKFNFDTISQDNLLNDLFYRTFSEFNPNDKEHLKKNVTLAFSGKKGLKDDPDATAIIKSGFYRTIKNKSGINDRKFINYNLEVRPLRNSYETSRIYGLKEKLDECPNILLSKEEFKKTYKSTMIPDYMYSLNFTATDMYIKMKSSNPYLYKNAISEKYKNENLESMMSYILEEIKEVFSLYGEVEYIKLKNCGHLLIIKNVINFYVLIETIDDFKVKKIDGKYELIKNVKYHVSLHEGEPEFKEKRNKEKDYESIWKVKPKFYFQIEFRYLDFLKNPNYYVICMTPHGYLRLKKEYSINFIKKISYHYLFKRYFDKYGLELNHEELEENPSGFFSLISMLKI
jgi:hypothetical protein